MMIAVAKKIGRATWRAASRDVGFSQRLVRLGLAAAQDRLRHHDGAVDDDAEVDGAERQQIGGNAGVVHQDEGRHHGKRHGDADDQGAARAAEEQHEHDEHEADAGEHGVRRPCRWSH